MFQGDSWVFYSNADMNLDDEILSLANHNDGSVWVGSFTGISRYRDGNWTLMASEKDLGARSYRSLTVDSDGTVWTGSTFGLLSCRDGEWSTYRVDGPASWDIKAVTKDHDGDIWCATYSGVSRYDGFGWISYTMADGLPYNRICDVDIDGRGNIWVGSDGGVSMFDLSLIHI